MISLINATIVTVVLFVGIVLAGYGVYVLMELVDCTDKCCGPPPPLTQEEKEDVEMAMLKNSTKPYEGGEGAEKTPSTAASTFSVDDDTNDEADDDENAPCCSICLETYVPGDPILRPACCGTTFHAECFHQWRATGTATAGNYTKCPHCRQLRMYTMDQWKHAAGAVLGRRRTRGIAVPQSVQTA